MSAPIEPPPHPGEILQADFLAPKGLTGHQLAGRLDLPYPYLADVLDGLRSITPKLALILEGFFAEPAEFWLDIQTRHDLGMERESQYYDTLPAGLPDPDQDSGDQDGDQIIDQGFDQACEIPQGEISQYGPANLSAWLEQTKARG